MAVAALEIPHIMPVRFVAQSGEIPQDPRANNIHFDADWFALTIRDWQTKTDYLLKRQFNDFIPVYVKANTSYGCTVSLIDCHGKVWKTWGINNVVTLPNNYIKVGAGYVAAIDYYTRFRFAEITGLPEGTYWLYMDASYDLDGDAVVDTHLHKISEPISIATIHRGTSYIDCYTDEPYEDVFFPQLNVRISNRVEADIVDYTTTSNDTQFEDGSENLQMLAATNYRTAKYALTARVPEYVVDKLVRQWGCKTVIIDGLGFTKDIGAKFDYGRIARFPKVVASLLIREADRRQGAREILVTSFTVYTQSGYPYALQSLNLNDINAATFNLLSFPKVIHNSTEEIALVSALTTYINGQGYNGTFTRVASGGTQQINWTNGAGDVFVSGGAQILVNPFSAQLTTTNIAESIYFGNPNLILDYGDGTIEPISGFGTIGSTAHNYVSSGTHNLLVFGTFETIGFDDGYLNTVGGAVPAGLLWFVVQNSFTITTFDASVLSAANSMLHILSVFNCGALSTITNLNLLTLPLIELVSFAGDNLNTTEASNVVINIDNMVNNGSPNNGQLYVNNQGGIGGAPMNVTGYGAKNDLITNYGWNVITD